MTQELIDQKSYENLKQMVGDDFIDELLETYFEDSPRLIAEMRQALSEADASTFQRAAHSLKSSSANFGALTLADQARQLEYLGREGNLDGASGKLDELEATYREVELALRRMP